MTNYRLLLAAALASLLAACGDSERRPGTDPDAALAALILHQGLDGDPADDLGLGPRLPDSDPLIKLGQLLFFSKTLGGTFDAACASCHHPDFAGGDLLSLPVGVNAVNPSFLGPGRLVDHDRDHDPQKDGGPNVPRNSQTIINAALYRQFLFFDGRVSILAPPAAPGMNIQTPESGLGPDPLAGSSLLIAQARFPVTSGDEMRNFFHPELTDPEAFRDRLVARLRGAADPARLRADGPGNWLARFRAAFGQPAGSAETLVTYPNIQRALAAYEESLTFTNTPWKRYVQGDSSALDAAAKRGALLFLTPKADGGLGCAACHSGDFFTSERFYNTGFPQFGRGKRPDGRDFGRWQVTKQEADRFAFRVPSLINVAISAPFGHTGAFLTLSELLRYHADPVAGARDFDYTLQQLPQFNAANGNTKVYDFARAYTAEAIAAPNLALGLLPGRALSDAEVGDLSAFLEALTDDCLRDAPRCLAAWTPAAADDPDGNQLQRSFSPDPLPGAGDGEDSGPPVPYPHGAIALAGAGSPRSGFADLDGCPATPSSPVNNGAFFVERGLAAGLEAAHGFDQASWLQHNIGYLQFVMMAGGITAAYLDGDCLPDIMVTAGSPAGIRAYRNLGGGLFQARDWLGTQAGGLYTGIGVVDLDGDYRRELVLGNLLEGDVRILRADDTPSYSLAAALPMSRNTYGMTFGDADGDGYPDLYFGHWDYRALPGTAPAFWRNLAGGAVVAADAAMGTSAAQDNSQIWQFAPALLDIDQDGHTDLLVAADFGSSVVLHNTLKDGQRYFRDVTDRAVITDENGMGSAFGDFDNDGDLDWFVSSIFDPSGIPNSNWGVTGNRLYRNDSTPGHITFADVTETAQVRDGLWGWGACFADFNNDGWLDIFHVDGYGYVPVEGRNTQEDNYLAVVRNLLARFITRPGRLFMNQGDGRFRESATEWQIDLPMDGRGLACTDMDRDGDIDIVVHDHSRRPKYFENRIGHGSGRRFASIRLEGRAPNTDALGARVYVSADLNGNGRLDAGERQLQVAAAYSQFNSQNSPDLHFGLGQAGNISQLDIVWPDGSTQTFSHLEANRFLVFRQP